MTYVKEPGEPAWDWVEGGTCCQSASKIMDWWQAQRDFWRNLYIEDVCPDPENLAGLDARAKESARG